MITIMRVMREKEKIATKRDLIDFLKTKLQGLQGSLVSKIRQEEFFYF